MSHTDEAQPRKIAIFDTSLRDGEQAPGFSMNTPEKLRLARQLQTLGVDVLEAGFPIASSDDAEAVRLIAAEVADLLYHALVLLSASGASPEDVWQELRKRRK